jgi:plastocyanin
MPSLKPAQFDRVRARRNADDEQTFTADDGHSFDTGPIDTGASTSVTAPRQGRYPYHCTIHPFMHGTLVVR